MTKIVSDNDFDAAVLKASTPVLVNFWATWCAPCHAITPTLEVLATEFSGKVDVVKLNIEENPEASTTYGARSLPYLVIFKDGKVLSSLIGAHTKARIKEMMEKALV